MQLILLIILPVALLSYFLAGGFVSPFPQKMAIPSGQPRAIVSQAPLGAGKQLQINTFKFSSPTPTPQPSTQPSTCTSDNGTSCNSPTSCPEYLVTCNGNHCVNVVNGPSGSHGRLTCAQIDNFVINCPANPPTYIAQGWCACPDLNPTGNITSCMAKPVIYLYPEVDTLVDVKLKIPGKVTVSIPTYEAEGWQDVLAHPGGSLEYRGKTYQELYYESAVSHANPPRNGLVIPKQELYSNLSSILLRLGLKEAEKQEFLSYWMPRLTALPGNYILFSIFDPVEKERVDSVHLNPEPDTRIELLAYFKPLEFPIFIPPLVLPEKPPARKGFTMVEWGGTIDNNQ